MFLIFRVLAKNRDPAGSSGQVPDARDKTETLSENGHFLGQKKSYEFLFKSNKNSIYGLYMT